MSRNETWRAKKLFGVFGFSKVFTKYQFIPSTMLNAAYEGKIPNPPETKCNHIKPISKVFIRISTDVDFCCVTEPESNLQ